MSNCHGRKSIRLSTLVDVNKNDLNFNLKELPKKLTKNKSNNTSTHFRSAAEMDAKKNSKKINLHT